MSADWAPMGVDEEMTPTDETTFDRDEADGSAGARDPVPLSAIERRIVGCLLEKERTTPADFPLTLNSLERACNQQTSRTPVTAYRSGEIAAALDELKARGLVRFVFSSSNRATKYRAVIGEALEVEDPDLSMIGLLLLRGPQTAAELRARAQRWCDPAPGDVTAALGRLAAAGLVADVGRAPGQKEVRWVDLLGDVAAVHIDVPSGFGGREEAGSDTSTAVLSAGGSQSENARPRSDDVDRHVHLLVRRLADLEARVASLDARVDRLVADLGGVGD